MTDEPTAAIAPAAAERERDSGATRELLMRALASEVGSGRPLSFALFDLDLAGSTADEPALRALTAMLRQGVGREEHLAICAPGQIGQILPGVNRQLALAHADRVRIGFESLALSDSDRTGTPI